MKNLDGLTKNTKEVLLKLSEIKALENFVFVGGSALSIYLDHRKSEDIDLFTWNDKINKEELIKSIEKEFGKFYAIENMSDIQIDFRISGVKTTFFANNWDDLKNGEEFLKYIKIAPLKLLAGMKINTLFLRAKYRDYFDIYILNKENYFSLEEMYNIIHSMMPAINKKLFQMALTFTDDIEEDNIKHLNPKYEISKSDISKYFEKEIKTWINKLK